MGQLVQGLAHEMNTPLSVVITNLSVLGRHAENLGRVARAAQQANPSGRFGTPSEFGALCAYLCSTHAGYITGQNLLIDGGAFPGTF